MAGNSVQRDIGQKRRRSVQLCVCLLCQRVESESTSAS